MFLKVENDLITAWLLPSPSFESDSLKDLSLSVPGSSASSYCYSNIQRPVSSFRSSGQGAEVLLKTVSHHPLAMDLLFVVLLLFLDLLVLVVKYRHVAMRPDLVLVAVLFLDLVAVVKSHHLVEGPQGQMMEVLVVNQEG
ncbi:hypothetical protein BH23THE1_BH23THE1_28780 [soil metagenome]